MFLNLGRIFNLYFFKKSVVFDIFYERVFQKARTTGKKNFKYFIWVLRLIFFRATIESILEPQSVTNLFLFLRDI